MYKRQRYAQAVRDVGKSRSADLRELFAAGLGVHHAGMLRPERSLAERLFADGLLKASARAAAARMGQRGATTSGAAL